MNTTERIRKQLQGAGIEHYRINESRETVGRVILYQKGPGHRKKYGCCRLYGDGLQRF